MEANGKIARKLSEPADGYGLSSGATLRVQLPSEAVLSPSRVRVSILPILKYRCTDLLVELY